MVASCIRFKNNSGSYCVVSGSRQIFRRRAWRQRPASTATTSAFLSGVKGCRQSWSFSRLRSHLVRPCPRCLPRSKKNLNERGHATRDRSNLRKALKQTQSFVSKIEVGDRRLDLIQLRTICKAVGNDIAALPSFIEAIEQRIEAAQLICGELPNRMPCDDW